MEGGLRILTQTDVWPASVSAAAICSSLCYTCMPTTECNGENLTQLWESLSLYKQVKSEEAEPLFAVCQCSASHGSQPFHLTGVSDMFAPVPPLSVMTPAVCDSAAINEV